MKKKGGLGRGLEAFFAEPAETQAVLSDTPAQNVTQIPLVSIDPNPNQARRSFDEEKLQELADSIAAHGIVQPLVVVRRGDRYLLVAGERRWRAARKAGLTQVPVRMMDLSEEEIAEISLIENLQRDDLSPMEEAAGIQSLMEAFSLTQEEAAKRIGKSRSAVANALRLLRLPEQVRAQVDRGELSAGHARVLAGMKNETAILALAQRAIRDGASVRQMEEWGRLAEKPGNPEKTNRTPRTEDPAFAELAEALSRMMGTRVRVKGDLNAGKITMEYYSREDLERIYEIALNASGEMK